MNDHDYHTATRLFVECDLAANTQISLGDDQAHYVRHVMRLHIGSVVRLFNGRDGEWAAHITTLDKKTLTLKTTLCLRTQPAQTHTKALAFAPLKGPRLDILIEKAVELGVSDLYPVMTDFTQNRNMNTARMTRHITEAAEQCERLTVAALHDAIPLTDFVETAPQPIYAALERTTHPQLSPPSSSWCFLVGPEGGFSDDEKKYLTTHPTVRPVSLGENILRAETAAIAGLSLLILTNK